MAEVARFILTGSIVALMGVVITYLCTDILGLWYMTSSIIAFGLLYILVFILQKYWTFREFSTHHIPRQSMQLALLSVANLLINMGAMYSLVHFLDLQYILAQCAVYAILGAMNFFFYKTVIFRHI